MFYFMNKVSQALSCIMWLCYSTVSYAAFWVEKIDPDIQGWNGTIDPGDEWRFLADNISDLVANFLMFLYILAVAIVVYAGFLILTAAWDEEKVKKAKNIIIYAIIGLVVIYLAWAIVTWFIESILI